MGTRIKIDGVGTVEVDDSFTHLSPEEQQHTVEEIAASHQSGASTAPSPTPAPAAAPAPSGPAVPTFSPIERAIKSQFPNVKFTSDYRDPQHNREVGGVEGSLHTKREAVDMVGGEADTPEGREAIRKFLADHGVNPKEFLYHNAGSGNHLHIGATDLPAPFLQQFGDHPAPQAPGAPPAPDDNAPARQAEIASIQAQAAHLLRNGKEQEAIALLGQHQLQLAPGELDAFHEGKRTPGFTHNGKHPTHGGLRHDVDYYGDTIRRGIGDLMDAPANIADMEYQGAQAIGNALGGGSLFHGPVKDLGLPEWARPGQKLNADQDEAERRVLGYVPEAANAPQRYAGASLRLASGSVLPAAKLASLGKARAALSVLTGAVSGGVTGEAAHDVAPALGVDPDKARFFGQIAGSVAGAVPEAVKPIQEARFIKARVADPRTPFLAKIVDKMGNVADAHAPNGVTPKGRGPVSVKQINSIGNQFLNEVEPRLAKMDLPPEDLARFRAAIKNKDNILPHEIEALEGTPTGDAIAEGIRFNQAANDLTPGYNGYKPGPIRRAMEMGLSVVGAAKLGPFGALAGPIVRRVIRGDPADLQMSRLDAGRNALKRREAWAKLGQQTGADTVGQKTADFIQAHDDLQATQREAADAATQAKQDATSQRAKERADKQAQTAADAKAKADAKAARYGMSDKEYGNYTARSYSAKLALLSDPEAAKRPAGVQKALNKYQSAADTSASKLDKFDQDLNAPTPEPKPVKRSPEDLAIQNNMDQGLKGYHRAYADSISAHLGVEVKPADVLAALKKVDVSDVDPFQLRKFEMEHRVSPAAKAALLPRIEKVLRADKGVMSRTAPEAPAAPESVRKTPQTSNKPKSAEPVSTNVEQLASPAPEPVTEPSTGDYRPVKRRPEFEAAKAANKASFDKERSKLSAPDSPHPREIVAAAQEGLDRIRNTRIGRSVESAMNYFDDELGPHLRKEGFLPEEIDDLKRDVEKVAKAGTVYKTEAEFEKGAKVGSRGRPRKQPASDDVPF